MSKPYYNHDETWRVRRARGYASWGSHADFNYHEAILQLKQIAGPPRRVLDVGCGAGRFGQFLSDNGYHYTGIDASVEAIGMGREHYPDLDLRCLDVAAPVPSEQEPGCFAIVTSLNALHCLTEPEHRRYFWDFCWSALEPGGWLYLSTMGGPTGSGARASATPRAHLTHDELRGEFERTGGKIHWDRWVPTTEYNPIPNWYLIATK